MTAPKRLKKAETNKEVLFVPLLVIFETIWVLESVYEVARQEILESIDELLLMPVLQFETPTVIPGFIAAAQAITFDADCIVTGDKDLLVLKSFRGFPVPTPRAFPELLHGK